jgi:hypothetical protein
MVPNDPAGRPIGKHNASFVVPANDNASRLRSYFRDVPDIGSSRACPTTGPSFDAFLAMKPTREGGS